MNSNIKGIHHCEILVSDMNLALKFYTEILGLKLLHNPSSFAESKWLQIGAQELHLTPYPVPDANEERHFAIWVQDIEVARNKLTAKGVLIKNATPIPGVERFFIFDPFGNRIEFVQDNSRVTF